MKKLTHCYYLLSTMRETMIESMQNGLKAMSLYQQDENYMRAKLLVIE